MTQEAMKLALEALKKCRYRSLADEIVDPAITAIKEALANEALDKKAENARELGLDYEPAQQEPVETYIHEFTKHPHPGDFGIPRGHWWQAKNYAEQLCACYPAPQPAQPEQE